MPEEFFLLAHSLTLRENLRTFFHIKEGFIIKTRRIFIALFMLSALLTASAHTEMVNVIDLGEGSYTSAGDKLINITGSKGETILKALSVIPAGGTILISGDFKLPESINIKKPVTIKSINGSVLDAQGKDRVIRCEGNGIILENLTAINGGNVGQGGGINIDDASVDIINCKVMNNNGGFIGGGVNIINGSSVRLVNCEISSNTTALNGGGICSGVFSFSGTNNVDVINCTITGNTANQGAGGGIFAINDTLTMTGTTITGNTASQGGGLGLSNMKGANAYNCTISGNSPDDIKGKINIDGTVYSAENPTSSESDSGSSSGGGCNASGLGLLSLAILFIRRKTHRV